MENLDVLRHLATVYLMLSPLCRFKKEIFQSYNRSQYLRDGLRVNFYKRYQRKLLRTTSMREAVKGGLKRGHIIIRLGKIYVRNG